MRSKAVRVKAVRITGVFLLLLATNSFSDGVRPLKLWFLMLHGFARSKMMLHKSQVGTRTPNETVSHGNLRPAGARL